MKGEREIEVEAGHLREYLRYGVVTSDAVIAWAEQLLVEFDQPPYEIVDLSLMGRSHPLDVVSALEKLSPGVHAVDVLPAVLGLAYRVVRGNVEFSRQLARSLYAQYASNYFNLSEELRGIGWFDDAYDLAASGTYGSLESVQAEFERFTLSFAHHIREDLPT